MRAEVVSPDAVSTAVALPVDGIDGLEDLEESDITIPRITIDHEGGVFVDAQTGERFAEFDCIMLGLVRQRVLWPPTPGSDGEGPMCRAVNFEVGVPDPAKWVVKHNGITAQAQSGFTFDEVQAGNLNCQSCALKDWESHPNNSTPWCNEQFTFPIVRILDDGTQAPALISFQRTGLKPCKSYVSGFKQARRPLYTAITRITAVHQRKGTVEYVTPSFAKVADSDPTSHPQFSKSLSEIRTFITTPWSKDEDETPAAGNNVNTAPAAAPVAAPAPQPAATPVETAAPVEQVTHQAAETQTPVTRAEPVAQPAPAPVAAPVYDDDEPFSMLTRPPVGGWR